MKTPQQKIEELEQYICDLKTEGETKKLSMESINILTSNVLTAERIILEYYKLINP